MSHKRKVYGWQSYLPECRDARLIVAATSQAEAARIGGYNRPSQMFNLGETGNPQEIEVAMSKPGAIFWCSMSALGRRVYHEAGGESGKVEAALSVPRVRLTQYQQDAVEVIRSKLDPSAYDLPYTEETQTHLEALRLYIQTWVLPLLDVIEGETSYGRRTGSLHREAAAARAARKAGSERD